MAGLTWSILKARQWLSLFLKSSKASTKSVSLVYDELVLKSIIIQCVCVCTCKSQKLMGPQYMLDAYTMHACTCTLEIEPAAAMKPS